jgi:sarcosine oxidase gamma subunit
MPDVVLNSPLAEVLAQGRRVLQVDGRTCSAGRDSPCQDMFNLRGNPADAQFAAGGACEHTGLHLPLRPTPPVSIDPQRQLLWLGPDEWLLKVSDRQGDAIGWPCVRRCAGIHSAVVDVGHGSTTLTLQAPARPICWRAAVRWTCTRAPSVPVRWRRPMSPRPA